MKDSSHSGSHSALRAAVVTEPRKMPVQARSRAAIEAIHEAAIHVLLRDGPDRLTTVRVAERAGVSVGSLYQYYPNKQAVLFAVMERHLGDMATVMEATAEALHGEPLPVMVRAVVRAYMEEKLARPDVSAALYRVHTELRGQQPVAVAQERLRVALTAMLGTAEELRGVVLKLPVFLLQTSLAGAVRAFLETGAPGSMRKPMTEQMCAMVEAYLTGLRGGGGAIARGR